MPKTTYITTSTDYDSLELKSSIKVGVLGALVNPCYVSFRGNNNYNDTQDADIALKPLTTHPEEWAELEESKHTQYTKITYSSGAYI